MIDVTSSDIDGDDGDGVAPLVCTTPRRRPHLSTTSNVAPVTTSPQRGQMGEPPSTPSPTKRRQSRMELLVCT